MTSRVAFGGLGRAMLCANNRYSPFNSDMRMFELAKGWLRPVLRNFCTFFCNFTELGFTGGIVQQPC